MRAMVEGLEVVSVVDWLLGLDSERFEGGEGDMVVVVVIVVAVVGYGEEGGEVGERRGEEKMILKESECLSIENVFY